MARSGSTCGLRAPSGIRLTTSSSRCATSPQFLIDRAADQRNVADAAEPLYSSLDDKQKQVFIQEMVRLSHERGLD